MKISLVIPAYNEELYIKKCLLSIQKNKIDAICEVIVVDNGSVDTTSKNSGAVPFRHDYFGTQKRRE